MRVGNESCLARYTSPLQFLGSKSDLRIRNAWEADMRVASLMSMKVVVWDSNWSLKLESGVATKDGGFYDDCHNPSCDST